MAGLATISAFSFYSLALALDFFIHLIVSPKQGMLDPEEGKGI